MAEGDALVRYFFFLGIPRAGVEIVVIDAPTLFTLASFAQVFHI